MNNTLPARHSTKAVDRYRPFMEAVSANYPNTILIDPAPVSPDTFACRFRDAVAGVIKYNSGADLIKSVSAWSTDYTVACLKTGQVLIGKSTHVKAQLKPETPVGCLLDASIQIHGSIPSPTQKVLASIITLMEHHILEHATLTGVTEQTVQAACATSTRVIEVIEQNGTITLL